MVDRPIVAGERLTHVICVSTPGVDPSLFCPQVGSLHEQPIEDVSGDTGELVACVVSVEELCADACAFCDVTYRVVYEVQLAP